MIETQEINGRKTACWISGKSWDPAKKTMVFIHGSGGDHTLWANQYGRLAQYFNIAALDLPGHGGSAGQGEQDVGAYTARVKQIIEAFGIRKPVLVGHSLGAAITLCYALGYGESLSGIVPVGGGIVMPVNELIFDGLKTDPAAVIALAAKFSLAKVNRERLMDVLIKGMSCASPEVIYGDFLACSRLDVTAAVSQIRVPTLVICGDEDKMTPPAMSRKLAEAIPNAQLALIKDAGHVVMMENVADFNLALKSFVESLK